MLPHLPVKAGWSRVRMVDFPRALAEVRYGRKPFSNGRLVLEIPYGGIGDHLFYTVAASPEVVGYTGGIDDVQLSLRCADNYQGQLFKLIWGDNPYVGRRGDGMFAYGRGWTHSGARPVEGNFCDGIVAQLTGYVPPPGFTRPYLPRTSPRPKWLSDMPYVVIDTNRRSNRDKLDNRWEEITKHINGTIRERYHDHAFVTYASAINPHGRPREVNLGDYFSMIEHCAAFFGCYSGGAVLAAAYNKPAWIYCHHKDPSQSFEGHNYVELG